MMRDRRWAVSLHTITTQQAHSQRAVQHSAAPQSARCRPEQQMATAQPSGKCAARLMQFEEAWCTMLRFECDGRKVSFCGKVQNSPEREIQISWSLAPLLECC